MRQLRGILAVLMVAVLGVPAGLLGQTESPATTRAEPAERIRTLIAALADPDPQHRQDAQIALRSLGFAAHPALRAAAHSSVPQVRAGAQAVLKGLPWYEQDDPPSVRQVLEGYGDLDLAGRRAAIVRLSQLEEPAAWRALGRMAQDEPSDELRWAVVSAVRERHPERIPQLGLGSLDVNTMAPSMLALAGRARLRHDVPQAVALLRRSLELDAEHPVADRSGPLGVLEDLVRIGRATDHYEAAAEQVRRQYSLISDRARRVEVARDLYALHADGGPLKALDTDVATYPLDCMTPESLYTLAHLQTALGRTRLGAALARAGLVMGLLSPARHYKAAQFLVEHRWMDDADAELKALLRLCPGDDVVYGCNAQFRLADIAGFRKDYFARAEHFRLALEILDRQPGGALLFSGDSLRVVKDDKDNLRALMYWSYLKAAKRRGDAAAQRKNAELLAALRPTSDFMTLDLYPTLKEAGKQDDAQAIFDLAYSDIKANSDLTAGDPENLNRLAWLCARCGQHLEEALDLSRRAVARQPENPAFIDTEAETLFAMGKAAQAVELEKRALALAPKMPIFRQQIKRFAGESTTQPDEEE